MRTFLELLPYRFEQRFVGQALRAAWVRHRRRLSAAKMVSPGKDPEKPRRIFVDMTVMSNHDAGTGIQRVVRELALPLLGKIEANREIQFVAATRKRAYRHIAWPAPDFGEITVRDRIEMRAEPGDVFLGLDYSLDAIRRHRRQLQQFRQDGGSLWFLVHDLLPFLRPEWFSRNTVIRYKAWLDILSSIADGFLCNSPQTESELKDVLAGHYGLTQGYRTQVLPMSPAPMKHAGSSGSVSRNDSSSSRPRLDSSTPFALMVGTLEPRKGHADIVAAFDALWRRASPAKLVLIGRLGWHVDTLRDLILTHPEHGTKLLWFDDVDDEELFQIYEACSGVIVASHGEGFGLSVIESLGHGKPVLARDLPVFRMHEGKGVHYFPADASPSVLADATASWLQAAQLGAIPVTRPTADWSDSARIMITAITSQT